MRLTWKREARAKGLAGVCQGERGFDLYARTERGVEKIASVRPLYAGLLRSGKRGYYWYARHDGLGVRLRNTASEKPYATIVEAMAACLAYVQSEIARRT